MEVNNILIVDDEQGTLFGLKKVLEAPTIEIDTASTIDEAKRLISERRYHVIISDLGLTGGAEMEGYEIIQLARNLQPKSKVIVVTAHGGDQEKAKAMALGVDSFLVKPVSPTAIKAIIRSMGTYSPSD